MTLPGCYFSLSAVCAPGETFLLIPLATVVSILSRVRDGERERTHEQHKCMNSSTYCRQGTLSMLQDGARKYNSIYLLPVSATIACNKAGKSAPIKTLL
jgi:hypothetical protein